MSKQWPEPPWATQLQAVGLGLAHGSPRQHALHDPTGTQGLGPVLDVCVSPPAGVPSSTGMASGGWEDLQLDSLENFLTLEMFCQIQYGSTMTTDGGEHERKPICTEHLLSARKRPALTEFAHKPWQGA